MSHFIDAHAHLDRFPNPSQVVDETREKGGLAIVSSGYDHEANQATLKVAAKHPKFVFPVIGLAPTAVMNLSDEQFEAQFAFVKENAKKALAIGEIGLDFHWPTKQEQIDAEFKRFKAQLEFALEMKLPVVIHSRKAEAESLEFLKAKGAQKVLLHYFSGTPALARDAVDEGWLFTVPPVKSRTRKELIGEMPLDSIMTESDSPYVAKHPSAALLAAEIIAEAKGISIEESLKHTTENAKRFFGLKL